MFLMPVLSQKGGVHTQTTVYFKLRCIPCTHQSFYAVGFLGFVTGLPYTGCCMCIERSPQLFMLCVDMTTL